MKTCKSCGQQKGPDQFVDDPTPSAVDKCLQCLPANANGFSECIRCKRRKRGDQFHLRAGGRRSRLCQQCYPRHLVVRVCTACNTEKPKSSFARVMQPGGGRKLRSECSDCYKPKAESRICYKCRERLSIDAFAIRSYYSDKRGRSKCRRATCCQFCQAQKDTTTRQCCHCHKTKPLEQFRKILWGGRSRRCKACPAPYNHGKGGDLLRKMPEPCLQCGEEMWTFLPKSRTDDAKFCSRKCAFIGRRPATRECNQCRATLPSDQFPKRSCNKAHSLWRCNQCLQDISEGRTIARPGSCTPTSLLRQLRAKAKRENRCFHLRYRDVRDLLLGPCCTCGAAPDTVSVLDDSDGIKPSNLRALCLQCRHFVGRRSLGATLAWVQHAAVVNNWAKPAGNALKRRAASPPQNAAPRMRRSDMVPSEVHGALKIGESWDDRVARHAKPKGPLGSKRKPDEELHV